MPVVVPGCLRSTRPGSHNPGALPLATDNIGSTNTTIVVVLFSTEYLCARLELRKRAIKWKYFHAVTGQKF
jgi:hypothetical protein